MPKLSSCGTCEVGRSCEECSRRSRCYIVQEENPDNIGTCGLFDCRRYEGCKVLSTKRRQRANDMYLQNQKYVTG